jgi:hypothetical protein
MRYRLLVALVVGFSALVVAQDTISDAKNVSVCELAKNPRQFHGRTVQVRARVYPAMIDTNVALVDSTCDKSIPLDIGRQPAANNEPTYREFSRYLSEGRIVEATVSGRFVMILVPSQGPHLRLRLLRVTDVTHGPSLLPVRRKH